MSIHSENCGDEADDACTAMVAEVKELLKKMSDKKGEKKDDATLSDQQLDWAKKHYGFPTRPTSEDVRSRLSRYSQ